MKILQSVLIELTPQSSTVHFRFILVTEMLQINYCISANGFYRAMLYCRCLCCHCVSVRLSQAGTVPKWLNVESCKQCLYDSPGL